jgi:hypothetical protein
MHWIMGRIGGSLGYVNIAFGIALYGQFGKDISGLGIGYGVWTILLIGGFVFASIRIGQTHDEPAKPSLKGYAQMGDPETPLTEIPLTDF